MALLSGSSLAPKLSLRSRGDGAGGVPLTRLIDEARAGEPEAMARLLVHLRPRLRRFGLRLCGQVGEDALQEALLTIASRLEQFRGEAELYSWAYALVRSACGRQLRGLENAPKEPLTPEVMERSVEGAALDQPEAGLIAKQRSAELNCALASLDEGLRSAVVLRDVEDLSATEAASVLGISVPALKSRLHRGRKALAAVLLDPERQRSGCPDVISGLSQEREGDLSRERCAELEGHLSGCPDCLARCQEFKRALRDSRCLPAEGEGAQMAEADAPSDGSAP